MNNGDVCSFLDSLYEHRAEFESYFERMEIYEQWKESVIAYYSDIPVTQKPQETLDDDERIARRNALLEAKKYIAAVNLYFKQSDKSDFSIVIRV